MRLASQEIDTSDRSNQLQQFLDKESCPQRLLQWLFWLLLGTFHALLSSHHHHHPIGRYICISTITTHIHTGQTLPRPFIIIVLERGPGTPLPTVVVLLLHFPFFVPPTHTTTSICHHDTANPPGTFPPRSHIHPHVTIDNALDINIIIIFIISRTSP